MSNGLISIHKTKILLCWNAFKHQIQKLSQNRILMDWFLFIKQSPALLKCFKTPNSNFSKSTHWTIDFFIKYI